MHAERVTAEHLGDHVVAGGAPHEAAPDEGTRSADLAIERVRVLADHRVEEEAGRCVAPTGGGGDAEPQQSVPRRPAQQQPGPGQ
ncbi:hypothetical protein GCM10029963_03590 [Micromonospora andamanensis]